MSRRMNRLVSLVVLLLIFSSPTHAKINFSTPSSNPYEVLGVSSTATLEQIKRRYRTLAKEHHPDKGGNPEMFAKIANAYEILSDRDQRRQFDHQQRYQRQHHEQTYAQRKAEQFQREKQEREAKERQKEALKQARMMQRHLLSLHTVEDLFVHGIMNEEYIFQKNFFGVFVRNKKQELIADEKFLFPYPFWGEARNGMKWEDVIHTVKIRYNKVTDLTTLFDAPQGYRSMPYVVFVRAGRSLQEMNVFSPRELQNAQEELEAWVTNQLVMRVTFINRHYAAVKLFLVKDQILSTQEPPVLLHTLKAGQVIPLGLHLGDKVVAVDARVDAYPGASPFDTTFFQGYPNTKFNKSPNPDSWYFKNPAVLGEYFIGLMTTTYEIEEERCIDLSLKCQSWTLLSGAKGMKQHPMCRDQPEFMHRICPASCGICRRKTNQWSETLWYSLQQAPIYYWPALSRPVVKFYRSMMVDLLHLLEWRRTIAFIFLVMGATLGLNLFVLPCYLVGGRFKNFAPVAPKFTVLERSSLAMLGSTMIFWTWLQFGTSPHHSSLRRDWDHILEWQMDAFFGLVLWGIACVIVMKIIQSVVWQRHESMHWTKKIKPSMSIMISFAVSTIAVVLLSFVFDPTSARVRRWQHLWRFRKNLSCVLALTGIVMGMAIPTLCKAIRKYLELFLVILLDVGVLLALAWISLEDPYFMEDLNHVLQMRMSAAIPIGILGSFIGIGVPFSILRFVQRKTNATIPSVPTNKIKSD